MQTFNTVKCGELAGSLTAVQLPDVACTLVKLKAQSTNAGKVYVGGAGDTKDDGSTDITSGYPLAAGEESPWIPIPNLSKLYRICDNVGDALSYIALT